MDDNRSTKNVKRRIALVKQAFENKRSLLINKEFEHSN